MPSSLAEKIPAYLAIREIFLAQLRQVSCSATKDEKIATAKRLALFPDGHIELGNDLETDCLVDWLAFQLRRQGRTLSQIAHDTRGRNEPAEVRAVLAGMAEATLGLVRVVDSDPGIGIQLLNTWTGQAMFMFEREVSRQASRGDHLLLRPLVVGDVTFSGTFTMMMPTPLLDAIRQKQAAGILPSMESIAVAGPQQDDFVGSLISVLMRSPHPAPVPMPSPGHRSNVGRNDPCPCGSGRKFKKCCGR